MYLANNAYVSINSRDHEITGRGNTTLYERISPYVDVIIAHLKEFEYKWKFLYELPDIDLN